MLRLEFCEPVSEWYKASFKSMHFWVIDNKQFIAHMASLRKRECKAL